MIIVQIPIKIQQIRSEHRAVLANPLTSSTQLCAKRRQRRIHRNLRDRSRQLLLLIEIHLFHHVQNNGIPKFPTICILIEQKLLRRSLHARIGGLCVLQRVVSTRENGNRDSVGRAKIAIEIVVFDEAVRKEKTSIVASTVGVHDLRALAKIEEGSDDKGLLFVVVFPGGLTWSRVVQHIGERNEDSVVQRVEIGPEVAARDREEREE